MLENPPLPASNPFQGQVEEGEGRRSESDKVDSILFEFLVDPSKPAIIFPKELYYLQGRSYTSWLIGNCDLEWLPGFRFIDMMNGQVTTVAVDNNTLLPVV
jgi:hypothetical protein